MRFSIAAALALTAASSLSAQAIPDLSTVAPLGGSWSWTQTTDGSEATFTDPYSRPQLIIHCTRDSRRLTISKPATVAAPSLGIWTSSQSRSLPATFSATDARLSASLPAFDSLLDAMTTSSGRVGVTVSGSAPLVVPPWAEIGRVVEDCRV